MEELKMDLSRQLKTAITTGSLLFGQRQTLGACARGDARLVVIAANCPTEYIDDLRAKHPEVTVHQAHIVNRDLGVACGKPFSISTLCVLDAGDSELLQLDDNMS